MSTEEYIELDDTLDEIKQRKFHLDFFETLFVDAFIGDVSNTLEVLKASGVEMGKKYAERLYSSPKIKKAISARGENPIRTALIMTAEELRIFWTQGVLSSMDPRLALEFSKLLGKSLGTFIEKKEITLTAGHEAWLKLLNNEGVEDAASSKYREPKSKSLAFLETE